MLNNQFRHLTKGERAVQVLSFLESLRTNIPVGPGQLGFGVVPMESGYPGMGKFYVMEKDDHISIAKPVSKECVGYRAVREFVEECTRGALEERRARERKEREEERVYAMAGGA